MIQLLLKILIWPAMVILGIFLAFMLVSAGFIFFLYVAKIVSKFLVLGLLLGSLGIAAAFLWFCRGKED